MRITIAILSLFIVVACQPKKKSTTTPTPPAVAEKIGIYKNAIVYAASTDYEFEIDGKSTLIRVSNIDSENRPIIPKNLTVLYEEGPPETNPTLIGANYKLIFGPQSQLQKIELMGNHDPSNLELPAIPSHYTGLLSVGPSVDSRAYLQINADLSAVLLINYGEGEAPLYKFGRWTRTEDGQKVIVQLEAEQWEFLVKEQALFLVSRQMGSGGLTLMANEDITLCHYVSTWLSDLSTTDGEKRVKTKNINPETPLDKVLRTEHAYMSLYGELESTFKVEEAAIGTGLRANPTVQGICDLIL